MPLILPVNDMMPVWGEACFIADNATIVGSVTMGDHCSVWFNTVIRGDVNTISIGSYTNIQDGAVIHATYQRSATIVGNYVSIGHNALVHGCTIKDHVLVGMGAIVMDRSVIENYCIIGAGAVVLENSICESGFIYAGNPARKIKAITDTQRQMLDQLPLNYVIYADWFKS